MALNQFYVPRFGDLERDYACRENVEYVRTACCVCGYHKAVGELLAWEREPKNTVGTYCGSKERQLSDTERKVVTRCHESPAGIEEEAVLRKITS